MRHLGPAGRLAAVLVAVAGLTGLTGPPVPAAPASARVHEAPAEVAFRQARTFALAQLARTDRRLGPGRFPTVAVGDSPWRT
jgi:hypothetical protein